MCADHRDLLTSWKTLSGRVLFDGQVQDILLVVECCTRIFPDMASGQRVLLNREVVRRQSRHAVLSMMGVWYDREQVFWVIMDKTIVVPLLGLTEVQNAGS